MCGIIGYIGVEEKATNMIIEGLSKLEYRGYDSAGIAIFTPSGIRVEKTKGKLINLADHLKEIGFPQGYAGIGPVSYTHLDVYKRQGCDIYRDREGKTDGPAADPRIREAVHGVSV